MKCSTCNAELQVGDWPWCDGNPNAHIPTHLLRNALNMEPIVVDRRLLDDGSYSFSYPGRSDAPVDAGYERIALTNLREADRFVKDRNTEEQELRREQIGAEQRHWEEKTAERRATARRELENRLGKSHSKIGEMVQRQIDARREKKYRELASRPVNFHIQALSYDQSNQHEYDDERKSKVSVVVNGFRK